MFPSDHYYSKLLLHLKCGSWFSLVLLDSAGVPFILDISLSDPVSYCHFMAQVWPFPVFSMFFVLGNKNGTHYSLDVWDYTHVHTWIYVCGMMASASFLAVYWLYDQFQLQALLHLLPFSTIYIYIYIEREREREREREQPQIDWTGHWLINTHFYRKD